MGYAGLKDRHAVTVQWFSVPNRAQPAEFWSGVHTGEFRVLAVHANSRKLKRGALSANRFRIRLHKVAWSRQELDQKLAALRAHGAPNYFGPQRFGRDGYNLDRVAQWVQSGTTPRGRAERGFALSAARALLFNAVLARRVQAGDWSRLEKGDLASLDGSGSHFRVADSRRGTASAAGHFRHSPDRTAVGARRAGDAGAIPRHRACRRAASSSRLPICSRGGSRSGTARAALCGPRIGRRGGRGHPDIELQPESRTVRDGGAARDLRFQRRAGTRIGYGWGNL